MGKNNKYVKSIKEGTKVESYSIKKFKAGAASVVIGASIFLGAGAVAQASEEVSNNTTADNTTNTGEKAEATSQPVAQPKVENTKESVASAVAAKVGVEAPKAETPKAEVKQETPAETKLDKSGLENYINEISANLEAGKYANKTDASVAVLTAELESARATLASAKTQAELNAAYNKLVTTVNSKLVNKPVEKKETPEVDTTNGQPTVGKKAENTEKKSESNSIENTGSNDSRNGKALDRNNVFRAETTQTQGNFNYSMEYSNGKEIYLYNEENADIDITVSSTAGNITKATVKAGSGQFVLKSKSDQAIAYAKKQSSFNPPEEEVEIDGYGWSYHQTLTETQGPVTIKITGKPNDTFKGLKPYTKTEDQRAVLGARYLQLEDSTGSKLPGGNNPSAPGYFNLVVKSQTYKYDIQPVAEENKVAVVDINNLTPTDINKIKEKINIQYSDKATKEDARLASKKGEVLQDRSTVVKEVAVANGTVTVTYNDDSVDTTPVASVARTNPAPTVELPYSNVNKRQIYVYTGENTDLTFTGKDETTVKDLYLRGPGGVGNDNAAAYGFTTGKIDNGAVTNGEGTVSGDKRTATIKMTGITTLKAPNQWTSFIEAKDNDDFKSMTGANYDASTDDAVRQQKPGYVQFIVKNQTSKYEISAPTEKVAVADPANVTEAELDKIKEKLKLEYNKDNDDANLADKKGKNVDDKDAKIKSVTKDANGNLVVTYTDGSQDTRALSDFVTIDKQPALDAVNKAAEDKIAEINKTPNATDEEKAAAIAKVNADKEKAVAAINDSNLTTKAALDQAKDSGATAIAADNPVVTKKDAAKADVEAARKAKADAITADKNLSQAEKEAAIAKINKAAEDATNAIDAATTDAAVDTVKNAGTTEFGKVNPIAKENAKEAIANALTAKNQAIDARTDLTQEEKDAAKVEAKKLADAELAKVEAQPDNAETADAAAAAQKIVNDAEDKGVADVTSVHPIAKEQAKQAVADELTKKEAEIDARDDLTQEEKDVAKKEAQDKAKAATDAINAQPAITDSADKATAAQQAVDTAKNTGVSEVKAVNPEAAKKPAAKQAIDDALKAKEKAIDARTDLSDKEKAAAKLAAKNLADAAKKVIDNATTDAEVDAAQTTGTDNIATVNPVAKEAAKQAVADELTKKEAEIDARDDLTQEEKDAAKKEAQDKAKEATDAINAQPDTVDTPEEATAAQQAVDAAKDKGVADVKAVNPEAKAKPAAKKAIDEVLKAKEAEIDARTDLTDEEKAAAKAEAKAAADKAKENVDKATTDATVKEAGTAGTSAVKAINPEAKAKPEAKKAIDEALKAKEAEIDARTDLTDEEKAAAKAEAKAVADKAKENVDKATTDAAVKEAETAGTSAVKAINPEAKAKPAAKKAIDDKLAEQLKAIENTPDATDEEKKVAADAARAIAEQAKKEIDAAKSDADVKALEDEAKAEIEKSLPLVEDKPNARKAIDEEAKAKKAEIDARNDLSPKAKEALKAKVDKVANKAKAAIDAVSSVEDVNVIEEADKAAIKAIGDINRPIDKVLVKDPSALTDEEKAKILEEVKRVNPTAKEVKYNENGKIEVTTGNGDKGTINPAKLVKTEEDLDNGKGGNDINKPLDKVIVKDPANLTDEEKAKIVAKVEEVNPDAIVTIDENGTVSVSTPDGKTSAIPASDLVRTKEDTEKAGAGNSNIVKPADKVVGEANDPDDQAKAEEKLRELNPETKSVKFDENGNATVTLKDGTTATIPSEDLFRSETDVNKPNAGNDVVKPADKTLVKDPNALTDEEKAAIAAKVQEVNPDSTVIVDDKGNATVTTKDGKTAVILGKDLVKTEADASKPNAGNDIVKPADKTLVKNPSALTDEEKSAIAAKVQEVNPDSTVVVDDKGNATVTTKDGKTAVIPGKDLVKTEADASKPNAGNDIVKPADKTLVKDPAKLTDEEKSAIAAKVQEVNPDATVVVDDKGNATVTTKDGKTAVIPGKDLVKTEADASKPNAGNDIVKPADKTLVKDPAKFTDEEKSAIAAKVQEVNPDATVVVDDKGNVTVTTKDGKTAVIPAKDLVKTEADAAKPNAGNDIVKPADKTLVKDPTKLTDEEKSAIAAKVQEVNPDATVVVDDKGNATVTTKDGKTAVIPAKDLVKTEADLGQDKAGNDINTPAVKTAVTNKNALTDAEKEAVKKAVEAVNPGATVVVDDKGNATVTTPEGKTAVIPASKLVIPTEKLADLSEQSGVNIPAARTLVADKNNLTPEEIAKIKAAVEAVNPGAIVVVDAKGNATVTTLSGKTATISAEQLIKDATDVAAKNNGENINLNFDKQVVADLDNLTDADKEGAKAKILTANPDVAEVLFDEEGNATVVLKDGKVFTILAKDIFMKLTPAPKASFEGNNKPNLVDKSKLSVLKGRLEEWTKRTQNLALEDLDTANKALEQAKSVLADPNASQADVQEAIRVIEEILNSSQNKSNVQSDQTRTETPVATQDAQTPAAAPAQAANVNQEATNARTVAKELPNTGTADSVAFMVAAAASAVLGLGLAGRRRKEDEEA